VVEVAAAEWLRGTGADVGKLSGLDLKCNNMAG
jgi:hypothetical protein